MAPRTHQRNTSTAAASGRARVVALYSLIGCVLSVIVVTAAVAMTGGGVGSVGAGLMVAAFDGLPFGAMIGAMVAFGETPIRSG